MMGYGAVVGNVFGAGVTLLPSEAVSTKTRSAVVLSTGVVGTGLGAWSHGWVQPTSGDWAMVGVGTLLSGIHIGSATYIVDQTGGFKNTTSPRVRSSREQRSPAQASWLPPPDGT